jgi:8-oxo-dGTP diphosphatase
MAFDHQEIIRYAYQRLKYKLEYTNIAQHFLAKYFTLTELQNIYEVILGYTFDTRNFRKKIKLVNIVKPTGKKQDNVKNRPAELYEFVNKKLEIKEIL